MVVTISGLPGAGTSTVARAVAAALGLERLDGGAVFRALAAERGLSLAAFSALAEGDDRIDLALDSRLAARAQRGDVVLESRLAGWIARNGGLAAVTVWITCADAERDRRVGRRDDLDAAAAGAANRARESSERSRYRRIYGIDLDDLSIYDLRLDSSAHPPDVLVERVLVAVDEDSRSARPRPGG